MQNTPDLWIKTFPIPKEQDHKYSRGQVAVLGGVEMTGAACLAADAAARMGAGLVTIIAPHLRLMQKLVVSDPLPVYKAFRPYIIARNDLSVLDFVRKAQKKGQIVTVIGPGLGDKEYKTVRSIISSVLSLHVPLVLDADGLNAFEGQAEELWTNSHEHLIITPHEGEFEKLFSDLAGQNREDAARAASERSGAVVVLKGHETVIASPDGQIVVNDNASPYLASAGSGDVLSGMIAGLKAQGMKPFDAACAAVWMHGGASRVIGAGLVASDIVEIIPKLLKETLGIDKKVG